MKDFQSFLAGIDRSLPGAYVVDEQHGFDPRLEFSAYVAHLEKRGQYAILRSDRVASLNGTQAAFPVVTNLFATRVAIAAALDLPPACAGVELALEYARRAACQLEPVILSPREAPVREVVAKPDLHQLPVLTHHLADRGPYLTPVGVARDPETGVYNASFHRAMVVDERHLTIFMEKRHLWDYYSRAREQGRPLPFACVLGHHPGFFLGSCALTGLDSDEYRTIGGILGEPLRLVPSETFGADLLVPADAEMVVEGRILPDAFADEGPFGDFTGYYSPAAKAPLMEVTAITHRRGAILIDVFVGHRDHALLGSVPKEGGVYERVRSIVPGVRAVNLPQSGTGRLHCYVAIEKRVEGEPRLAAMAALTASELIKHVIVVDDDIDVYDDGEVLWAMATRMQADRDVDIIRGVKGSRLDPSAPDPDYAAKLIIDATRPLGMPYAERLRTAEWRETGR
jgi:2,5-furandicarboxylate decarboxylase 1